VEGHPAEGDTPLGEKETAPARRSLVDWVAEGAIPWPYETAKKYRQRDTKRGTFPVQGDYLYTEEEIRLWVSSRTVKAG
jgi:hypothetical protein